MALNHKVGAAPAAQSAIGAEHQSILSSPLLSFPAHLNRLSIGKGFASAHQAGGMSIFMTTDPCTYRLKGWRMGLQRQPKAMPGWIGWVVIEANPSLASIASTPVQAQGPVHLLESKACDRFLNQWIQP
jgi:hypothetical protein